MINRTLIRIKVIQLLYSFFLTKDDTTLKGALAQLSISFEKSYELYNYLLLLMIELTELQDRRLDDAKNKYLPSEEDLNPNIRFVENKFIEKLKNDDTLQDYISENKLTWKNDDIYLKLLLDKVVNSDVYKNYMSAESTDYEKDCEIWKQLMKQIILPDENLADLLEKKSVYWNDDLDTMGTFTLKTIRRFAENEKEPILPMFKDDEDRELAESYHQHNNDEYVRLPYDTDKDIALVFVDDRRLGELSFIFHNNDTGEYNEIRFLSGDWTRGKPVCIGEF